jgi:hypothetical protein
MKTGLEVEEDLCDQLFNHSELRLACTLLKLARAGHRAKLRVVKVPAVGHKKLAHIVRNHSVEDHLLHE